MKIVVPLTNDRQISDHFGQSDYFGVYTIADNREITSIHTVEPADDCGCKSNIASQLAADGVTVMLASGMGGGAFSKFTKSGISVMRGWSGNAEEVINAFLAGKVIDLGSSCHKHGAASVLLERNDHHHAHDHGHGHEHSHAHSCGCAGEGQSCGCN